jgi:hypothetical protein
METKQITFPEKYRNGAGEEFEYVIQRHTLTPEHDYWLYTIQAKHNKWGFRAFGVEAVEKPFSHRPPNAFGIIGHPTSGIPRCPASRPPITV